MSETNGNNDNLNNILDAFGMWFNKYPGSDPVVVMNPFMEKSFISDSKNLLGEDLCKIEHLTKIAGYDVYISTEISDEGFVIMPREDAEEL